MGGLGVTLISYSYRQADIYIYKSTQRAPSEHPGYSMAVWAGRISPCCFPGLGFVPSFPAQTRGWRNRILSGKKVNQCPDPCWDAAKMG